MTYRLVVCLMIVSALPPAALIVILGQPRSLRDLWNRADVGMAAAFLVDGSRRALLLLSGIVYPYPGHFYGVLTYLTLAGMSLALWARALQLIYVNQLKREKP